MSNEINPRPNQQFHIAPASLLVVPYVRIVGGKSTLKNETKTEKSGDGIIYVKETSVLVTDAAERKKAEDFATRVRNFARSVAHFSPLGYIAHISQREELTKRSELLEQEAGKLNEELKTCKVVVHVVLLQFGIDLNEDVAKALNDSVLEKLTLLKTALESGDQKEAKKHFNNAKNVLRLVTGVGHDSVKYALEEARDSIKTPAQASSFPQLENAISLFTPATNSIDDFDAFI